MQSVCTRLFFSPPKHKSLGTRLDTWYYGAVEKKTEECLGLEQSCELFSDIRGTGGASTVMLASTRE